MERGDMNLVKGIEWIVQDWLERHDMTLNDEEIAQVIRSLICHLQDSDVIRDGIHGLSCNHKAPS